MPQTRRNTMASLCMAAAVLATPVPAQFVYESKSNIAARATYDHNAFAGATLVQMFEWPYDSIAAECEMLGKAGYTHVQISPPMEHIKGSQWWTSYQPVSYKLTSKRGNAQQLSNMVKTCGLSNVKIIVDAVINHMSAGSGTGFAGTKYSKYSYPEHPSSAFHYCAGNGKVKNIADYNNVKEVQECELVGLSDLDQSQSSVSKAIETYLNSLVDLGIAGFRVDAAKHIDQQQLGNILKNVRGYPGIFVTQETIGGGGDPQALRPTTYAANGHVHEFGAAYNLKQHFDRSNGKEIQWLVKSKFGQSWGLVESRFANTFIANHDTERESTPKTLTSRSANNAYVLASIFMLGWDYGVPTVLSGYDFDGSFDKGAPQDANTGLTNKVECFKNGFRCEHRWQAISNMVYLRKVAGKEAVSDTATGNAHQIAFGRGKRAFVAINNDSAAWTSTFKSALPAGKYCNIIVGDIRDCASPITVASDGSFTATINPFDALAFVAA